MVVNVARMSHEGDGVAEGTWENEWDFNKTERKKEVEIVNVY